MTPEQAQEVLDYLGQIAQSVNDIYAITCYITAIIVVLCGLVAAAGLVYFLFHGKWR